MLPFPFFRYLVNQTDAVAATVASALIRGSILDESVVQGYTKSVTKVQDYAHKHYHNKLYPYLDLPMHQLTFVLHPDFVGSNCAFYDVGGTCH